VPIRCAGPGERPVLDVFIVALNQACEGDGWYTSTKELQRASLQLCAACRSVTTLGLRVNCLTPRRLLAAAVAPPSNHKRRCATRVPQLRARHVRWEFKTAAELSRSVPAFADASSIEFCDEFVGTLDDVSWPRQLKRLKFEYFGVYDGPIVHVAWPASLERMEFGVEFNQPITGVRWPASLQHV
ncbi:unnamed protein product, partial [Hapterophycus canaliculatus]